jgi:hypothetical protein
MAMSRVFVAAFTAGFVISATVGYGQGVGTPYRSPNPPLSPWLNLYQKKGGPVDNYHMYVQPDLQLRDTLQQQQSDIQRQTSNLTTLGHQVTQMQQERTRLVAPTGQGGGFMNHGHYFSAQSAAAQGGQGGHGGRSAGSGRRSASSSASQSRSSVGGGF